MASNNSYEIELIEPGGRITKGIGASLPKPKTGYRRPTESAPLPAVHKWPANDLEALQTALRINKVKEAETMTTNAVETERKLVESFKRLGFSDEAAHTAARGREGAPADAPTEDRLFDAFKRMGLSESAARVAARGR